MRKADPKTATERGQRLKRGTPKKEAEPKRRKAKEDDLPPVQMPKKVQIKSLEDVRLQLQSVYNRMNRHELSIERGSKLTYVLNSFVPVLEKTDLLVRLEAIENQVKSVRGCVSGQFQ
jgi:hypothetical protein